MLPLARSARDAVSGESASESLMKRSQILVKLALPWGRLLAVLGNLWAAAVKIAPKNDIVSKGVRHCTSQREDSAPVNTDGTQPMSSERLSQYTDAV